MSATYANVRRARPLLCRPPLRGHGSAEFARLVASPPQLASAVARIAALAARSGERVRATQTFASRTALANGSDGWTNFGVWRERAQLTDEQPASVNAAAFIASLRRRHRRR